MKQKNLPVWLLILVISLTPVNAVLFAPALPKLTQVLDITQSQGQMTIALFLVGYALSQLAFGSIANFLGRKKTLILGVSIGVAGSLISVLAFLIKNYHLLLYSRFLVGFGAASGLIITYAMVNDVYSGTQAKKVTGFIVASFAVTPGIANFLGGFLATIGANACFIFLFVYNVVILSLLYKLPETAVKLSEKFDLKSISKEYGKALMNSKIVIYGSIYGLFAGSLYAIITLLPFIGIQGLHMSSELFGIVFCMSYGGYFIGSMISSYMAERNSTDKSIVLGISIVLSGIALLIFSSYYGFLNIETLFGGIFIIFLAMPFIFVNASVEAVSSHHDKATASSVMNFINISLACLGSFLAGLIKSGYLMNLSYLLIVFMFAATVLLLVAKASKKSVVSQCEKDMA